MKLILAIPVIGLALSGAIRVNDLASNRTLSIPTTSSCATNPASATAAEPAAPAPDAPRMWISRARLFKGETLTLNFRTPNAPYLGVIDPEGKFFYLVYPADAAGGELHPLVDSDRFETMSTLRLETASLKADPYTYGITENQRVFTKSGQYRFILGEDLHSDDESEITVVTINYKHTPRPSVPSKNDFVAN